MSKEENVDGTKVVGFRLPIKDVEKFKAQCVESYGKDFGDLLREAAYAVIEGRLVIKPSKKQRKLMGNA